MSRTNIPGKFPQEIWDGLVPSTPDLNTEAAPDIDFLGRFRAEIRALETILASYQTTLNYIQALGVANAILGVKGDGNELEWKDIQGGPGITITHVAGTITISTGTWDYSANSTETINETQPVCYAIGGIQRANSNSWTTTHCLGLATVSRGVGELITYRAEGGITAFDWTASTGGLNLVPNAIYYLDVVAGKLTAIPPIAASQFVVKIGRAISAVTLDLDIRDPIRL